MFMVVAV